MTSLQKAELVERQSEVSCFDEETCSLQLLNCLAVHAGLYENLAIEKGSRIRAEVVRTELLGDQILQLAQKVWLADVLVGVDEKRRLLFRRVDVARKFEEKPQLASEVLFEEVNH